MLFMFFREKACIKKFWKEKRKTDYLVNKLFLIYINFFTYLHQVGKKNTYSFRIGILKNDYWIFWPIKAHSSQKQPDNFDEIFLAKADLGKYLIEKC